MSLRKKIPIIISMLFVIFLAETSLKSCKDFSSDYHRKPFLKRNQGNLTKKKSEDFVYMFTKQPEFTSSLKLSQVVDSIVQYNKSKSLPVDALSVTLIDTQTNEKAEYQGDLLRYPASVVKMFWLVAIYQKINQDQLNEVNLLPVIESMILKSENKAASQLIDMVTDTKSTIEKLSEKKLKIQQGKRKDLNTFFSKAGYNKNLNISQKIFPINNENVSNLNGFDRQLRGENDDEPIENKLTSNDAARLMYEIVKNQAIKPEISIKMKRMLTRNIEPTFWKKQPSNPVEFNPIESFFGQGLPERQTENIVSKAGRTSRSRQEVAFVKSKDGKTCYILAVFGDDVAYGKNKKIFPEISGLVYGKMRSALPKK